MNDYQFKIAKIKGEFIWHNHKNTDEAFIIIEGSMKIALNDRIINLSEGDLYIDDTLRATNDSIFTPIGNIKDLTLSESINSWQMQKYMQINNNLPESCNECLWKNICGGGRHIQRYSKEDDFNRNSVYCPSIRKIMSRTASHLIASGIPEEQILLNLGVIN